MSWVKKTKAIVVLVVQGRVVGREDQDQLLAMARGKVAS